MRYSYVIIDGNNAFWRAWYRNTTDVLDNKPGAIYTAGIAQFLKNIELLRDKYCYINNTKLYFLFDNTVSTLELRKLISNGSYKSHRLSKKAKKFLYKDLEYLIEILRCYDDNFRAVRKESCEADDLVKPLLKTLNITKNSPCLLISGDMDWSRSTEDYIHWYNYSEILGRNQFVKKYGFDPQGKTVQLYKAIRGDNSDNIKSAVPYLPEKIVLDIVQNFEDVNDLMSRLYESDYSEKWKLKIKKCEQDIRLNYRLVDFIDIKDNIEKYIYYSKENTKRLEVLFKAKDIPLESRMITHSKNRNKSSFLKRGD